MGSLPLILTMVHFKNMRTIQQATSSIYHVPLCSSV